MLRARKFAKKKNNPLNKFLREIEIEKSYSTIETVDSVTCYIDYFNLYIKQFLQIEMVKESVFYYKDHRKDHQEERSLFYKIKKDFATDTWFLTCSNLVTFYIDEGDIDEFYLSFVFSKLYKFVIYQYGKYYIAFCISHTKDEMCRLHKDQDDLSNFFMVNKHDPKFFILSHFLNLGGDNTKDEPVSVGFIILNQNIQDWFNKSKCNFEFYSNIGYGNKTGILDMFVKMIVKIDIGKHLPVNYLYYN